MNTVALKRLTIVAESVLEPYLIADLKRLGARGYTAWDVRGEGARGLRSSEAAGRNVRLEAIVSPEVGHRVLEHLAGTYFTSYAIIAYLETVEVVRGEKYV